jgi:hypothetical protein
VTIGSLFGRAAHIGPGPVLQEVSRPYAEHGQYRIRVSEVLCGVEGLIDVRTKSGNRPS